MNQNRPHFQEGIKQIDEISPATGTVWPIKRQAAHDNAAKYKESGRIGKAD
ncbi:MAG: hypothetical protein QGF59_07985 [Pirellulaceae bacterium]|nr:hypothetical protein [Pirellulaceae bacterium]